MPSYESCSNICSAASRLDLDPGQEQPDVLVGHISEARPPGAARHVNGVSDVVDETYRDARDQARCSHASYPSVSVAVVEAVAWTAIALLATTLLGSLFYLGHRIDSLIVRIDAQGADLGRRIESLSGRIETQGTNLGGRIDSLSARIDALSGRMDTHLERHAG